MIQRLQDRRETVRQARARCILGPGLWRDAAVIEFPDGSHGRSRALYWMDDYAHLLIDEYGETAGALPTILDGAPPSPARPQRLYRLVNKNQLAIIGRKRVLHLSPCSWTLHNPLESEMYEFIQRQNLSRATDSPAAVEALIAGAFALGAAGEALKSDKHAKSIREKQRVFRGLDLALQQLLVILDSDLGSEQRPLFVVRDSYHPAQLNFASNWRCYVSSVALPNVLNAFMPPILFGGFDIYGRPVAARRPSDRINQYCVVEVSNRNLIRNNAVLTDYDALLAKLFIYLDQARGGHGSSISYFGHVDRTLPTEHLKERARYLFWVWSKLVSEFMIEGDHEVNAAYDIEIKGDMNLGLCSYLRCEKPFWSKADKTDPAALVDKWFVPRFSVAE